MLEVIFWVQNASSAELIGCYHIPLCHLSTLKMDVVSCFSVMNVLYLLLASHFNICRFAGRKVNKHIRIPLEFLLVPYML